MKQWWLRLRGYRPQSVAYGRYLLGGEPAGHFTTVLCRHPRTGKVGTFQVGGQWSPRHFLTENIGDAGAHGVPRDEVGHA